MRLSWRQVKAPKIYLGDSGLLHAPLGLPDARAIETHPKVGASWEGFVLEAVIARLGARPEECFFWATYSGAELDLFVVRGPHRIGVEIKRTTGACHHQIGACRWRGSAPGPPVRRPRRSPVV